MAVTNAELKQFMEKRFGEIREDLQAMNGRERENRERITVLESNQNNCPVFKSRFNMNDPKVFIGTVAGLFTLYQVVSALLPKVIS